MKTGVAHPERPEYARAEKVLQRLVSRSREQDRKGVGSGVVEPPLTRLMDQRELAELLHPLAGSVRRRIRAGIESRLGHRLLDRILAPRCDHRPDSKPEGQ